MYMSVVFAAIVFAGSVRRLRMTVWGKKVSFNMGMGNLHLFIAPCILTQTNVDVMYLPNVRCISR